MPKGGRLPLNFFAIRESPPPYFFRQMNGWRYISLLYTGTPQWLFIKII